MRANNSNFKKAVIYTAMLSIFSGNVYSADETIGSEDSAEKESVVNENGEKKHEGNVIVITGKRASLTESIATKREAEAILDSISSEELGKFPDANVADSLSHITGIAVQRTRGGEGQHVSIRGLGADFSIVTLNDRILATDDDGRDFAFDVLPSEMISGADVFKSVSAKNLEGSIGGLINLRSARPFDKEGLRGAWNIEGNYNDLSEDSGYKLSGFASNTFANNTMGILAGLTYSDTNLRTDSLTEMSLADGLDLEIDGAQRENVNFIEFFANGVFLEQRKRTGFTTAFQYRPSDKFEMTVDLIATRLDSPAQGFTQSYYLGDIDERGSNIVYDEGANLITGATYNNFVPEILTQTDHRVVDTYQLGWNGEYDVNEKLTLTGDVYWSKSQRDAGGKDNFVVAGIKGDQTNGGNTGTFSLNNNGLPNIQVVLDSLANGRTFEQANDQDFGVHFIEFGGTDVTDEIVGAKFDGDYAIDFDFGTARLNSVNFGIQLSDRQKTRTKIDNETSLCLYCNYPFTFASVGASVVRGFPVNNYFDGVSGNFPRSFAVFDINAYLAALRAADGTGINPLNGIPYDSTQLAVKPNLVQSYDITEKTTAAYLQGNFEGDNWKANLGLRYVQTDLSSSGATRNIVSVTEFGDGEASISDLNVVYSDPVAISTKTDYSKLLPSLNFQYSLSDDLLLRSSYAKVMARPGLDQLSFLVDDVAPRDGWFFVGQLGNAKLKPIEADQADLGLEWYFSDSSALTGVIFWKDITGFITTVYEEGVPAEQIITGAFDPDLVEDGFETERVVNGDAAKVLGIEVGYQHFFDNGFGVVANYTYTDTESIVEGEVVGDLEGVSKNAYSLSFIYEKDAWSAQLSTDFSGELIESNDSLAGEGIPVTTDSISWMTASVHYNITDEMSIYFEADNLLSERYQSYSGRRDVPVGFDVFGRTVNVGISGRF